MKGGEEERVREKAKGRKRRSEHRDRSVILLDCARSPVTFECSVDFTLAKGEHRRKKKKKTRTSIPSAGFLLSSSFLVPGPFPPPPLPNGPFPRAISPFLPSKHRFFLDFSSTRNFPSIQETSTVRSISSLAVEKETEEGGREGKRGTDRQRFAVITAVSWREEAGRTVRGATTGVERGKERDRRGEKFLREKRIQR